MRGPKRLWTCALLGLLGCGEWPSSLADEPRPCELRGEVCPSRVPVLLDLADLDHDGIAEFITAGLGWELSVASRTDAGFDYFSTRVPVERGQLSSCSSVDGSGNLVFYRDYLGQQWWLWQLAKGRLELVDSGRDRIQDIVACVDLGAGAEVIVIRDSATLVLSTQTFELQPAGPSIYAPVVMPSANGTTFSLFASMTFQPGLYVGSFDRSTGEVLHEGILALGLTHHDMLAVAGHTLVVAGRVDDEPELVIARELDPSAPVITELERASLPWRPKILKIAELDGDAEIEIVLAARPLTTIAVFGLGEGPNQLHTLELPVEGIDIATGDHDGDGIDEIYLLDPRAERIIELAL